MAKIIKNIDTIDHTYAGQLITASGSYTIQGTEQVAWANCAELMVDIANGKIVVNDGTSDITNVNDQINFLKDIDMTPRDSDGSPLHRVKITTSGWHYQLHGIEFELSKLGSLSSKKADNTDYNFSSIKFYKLDNGQEVEITGDDLNQTFLDTNCVKTVLDWEPTHDYELMGGLLKQMSAPSDCVHMWAVGVPDVPEQYGGSKTFISHADLKYIGTEEGIVADGKAPKYFTYNAQNHTNKLRFIFRHSAGFKHKLLVMMEIFKA